MAFHRRSVFVLVTLLTAFGATSPSKAARFDGEWSMLVVTTRGHCGVIPIGVRINGGRIQSTSGSFAFYPIELGGRISGSGQARLKAVAGPRIANGAGKFGKYQASGTWSGTGPSGLCSGVWNANRP